MCLLIYIRTHPPWWGSYTSRSNDVHDLLDSLCNPPKLFQASHKRHLLWSPIMSRCGTPDWQFRGVLITFSPPLRSSHNTRSCRRSIFAELWGLLEPLFPTHIFFPLSTSVALPSNLSKASSMRPICPLRVPSSSSWNNGDQIVTKHVGALIINLKGGFPHTTASHRCSWKRQSHFACKIDVV